MTAASHEPKRASGRGRAQATLPLEIRRLAPEHWPERDRAAWLAATSAAATPLDVPGAAAHLAPATRKARAGAWGCFVAFLASRGDLDPAEGPAGRLTEARLTAWIANLNGRVGPNTLMQFLRDVSLAIAAMAPQHDWSWVRRHPMRPTPAQLRAGRKPLAPFDPVALLGAALGECSAANTPSPTPLQARRFRDGLLLAVACHTALRRRNLAEIVIGRNLIATGEDYYLVFRAEETKTGEVLELRLPAGLSDLMSGYLSRHRPVLLAGGADHGRLWVNVGGEPLAYEALYGLFDRKSRALLGRRVNPHLTRHTLATTLLTTNPRDIATAAAALAHRGTRSVSEVYDRSERDGAELEWARVLRRLRGGGGRA
jgi:integrase